MDEATKLRAVLQFVVDTSDYLIAHADEYTVPQVITILGNVARSGLKVEPDERVNESGH